MSKKEVFLKFVNELMVNAPSEIVKNMPEDAKVYLEALCSEKEIDKPVLTDNGKIILKYLQDNPDITMIKAKNIADNIGISSRSVSGSLRKLVSDGFVEKIGQDPILYSITEKGKNIEIN